MRLYKSNLFFCSMNQFIKYCNKKIVLIILSLPLIVSAQIEKQIRDDSPGLFINQRVFHAPPKPFFKGRIHNLDFITDIPQDSIISTTLFFKTNFMKFYREFSVDGNHGLYRFKYDPKTYPATNVNYYFVIKTKKQLFGAPLNDKGELSPINKMLVDPVQYYKQQNRLNK